MTGNTSLSLRLGIAILALLVVVTIYIFARIYPPELLEPFKATLPILAAQTGIFGSAPSFFYTLALGLGIGACASSHFAARVHCLLWIGLAMMLELSQASMIAQPIATWLSEALKESTWGFVEHYWTRGTFDLLDMLATFTGGMISLALITYLPKEKSNANNS